MTFQEAELISEESANGSHYISRDGILTCLFVHGYFSPHQHEQCHRAYTCHPQHHHAHALLCPFYFSIFAQNEHSLMQPNVQNIHQLQKDNKIKCYTGVCTLQKDS